MHLIKPVSEAILLHVIKSKQSTHHLVLFRQLRFQSAVVFHNQTIADYYLWKVTVGAPISSAMLQIGVNNFLGSTVWIAANRSSLQYFPFPSWPFCFWGVKRSNHVGLMLARYQNFAIVSKLVLFGNTFCTSDP